MYFERLGVSRALVMKILAAVDGSEVSMRAAAIALAMSNGSAGSLTLIHVTAPFASLPEFGTEMPDVTVQVQRAADTILRHAIQTLGAPSTTALMNRVGSPAEVIADVADHEGFDVVVVGNTGRGAVARIVLGSVADRLVHLCSKAVLVVR